MNLYATDKRVDFEMREFVSKVIDYLHQGGDHANARMNMAEHSVPSHVQMRVLAGRATRY